jgi:hypothetical protein
MRYRSCLTIALLSLLLLGWQQEAQVHPLGHLADRLCSSVEQGAVAMADGAACPACQLLAGACEGPATAVLAIAHFAPAAVRTSLPDAPRAASPLLAYRSRAPPVLL